MRCKNGTSMVPLFHKIFTPTQSMHPLVIHPRRECVIHSFCGMYSPFTTLQNDSKANHSPKNFHSHPIHTPYSLM